MENSSNLIVNLTFNFSLNIIEFIQVLEKEKKYNLANQLFRSGTSVGANVNEAQSCESRKDFIHKMKIAAKEAEETKYWLSLCQHSPSYPNPNELLEKLFIIKVLNKIIVSSIQSKAQ